MLTTASIRSQVLRGLLGFALLVAAAVSRAIGRPGAGDRSRRIARVLQTLLKACLVIPLAIFLSGISFTMLPGCSIDEGRGASGCPFGSFAGSLVFVGFLAFLFCLVVVAPVLLVLKGVADRHAAKASKRERHW